jgi:hypothetical protein
MYFLAVETARNRPVSEFTENVYWSVYLQVNADGFGLRLVHCRRFEASMFLSRTNEHRKRRYHDYRERH